MRRHCIGCKVYETLLRLALTENNVMMLFADRVQLGGWDEGVDDVHTARTMSVTQPRSAQEATAAISSPPINTLFAWHSFSPEKKHFAIPNLEDANRSNQVQ